MWNPKKRKTQMNKQQKQKETTVIETSITVDCIAISIIVDWYPQWIPVGRQKGGRAREHEGIKRQNCYI